MTRAPPVNDLSEQKTFQHYRHPTVESINSTPPPRRFSEFEDDILALMASQGVHGAFKERMLREVMRQDKCEYGDAYRVLAKMNEINERYMWLYKLPYFVGIGTTLTIGGLAVPFVFDKSTAIWFCENYVKQEIPTDPAELDTWYKVGTFTWSWMEPMIGTASFVLLCCQFTRAQVMKMNMKTYAEHLLTWRANRLAKQFPEYDGSMVRAWAKHIPPVGLDFFPIYERRAGYKGFTSGL